MIWLRSRSNREKCLVHSSVLSMILELVHRYSKFQLKVLDSNSSDKEKVVQL
jgi:hypothetical protein